MPYIGKSPVGGGFHKLDALTASATATYALTLGSAAYFPETANQLLVSLNGVIQAPQDSFTVSGSNLVFDSALTSNDSIDFIVALGDVLGVGTPSDGTVTDAKIQSMAASKLTGALPALDGSALTGISASNIKEKLVMLCDGNNYTVGSGTYTSQSVTAAYTPAATYADLTGSVISYTPPSGTTCVIYEFQFQVATDNVQHAILHNKFFIAGTEVTDSKRQIAGGSYPEYSAFIRQVIPIGGSASTATGRQASWSGAKELKIQTRGYGSGNEMKVHGTYYWDAATSTQFVRPNLTITAIG